MTVSYLPFDNLKIFMSDLNWWLCALWCLLASCTYLKNRTIVYYYYYYYWGWERNTKNWHWGPNTRNPNFLICHPVWEKYTRYMHNSQVFIWGAFSNTFRYDNPVWADWGCSHVSRSNSQVVLAAFPFKLIDFPLRTDMFFFITPTPDKIYSKLLWYIVKWLRPADWQGKQ